MTANRNAVLVPAAPSIVIPVSRDTLRQALAECWRSRRLLYVLVWRDLKARYKQTLLGAAWAVLQPFLAMVVFTIVFTRFAKVPSAGVPYPVFVFCGLLPWQFFAQGLTRAGGSLVENRLLLTRLHFPRLLLPASAVLIGLPDFAASFAVLLAIMAYYGFAPGIAALCMIPLLLLTAATALGLGLLLAALNVRYRDVAYTVPFFTQLWFFLTPVVYPSGLVPDRWRTLFALNPMVFVVDGVRWALLGGSAMPGTSIVYSLLGVSAWLMVGLHYFHANEADFADIV